ncbi:hypothetical protein Tco_1437699 [Tanacetum coccineum]
MKYVKPLSLYQDLQKLHPSKRGRLLGLNVGADNFWAYHVGVAVSEANNEVASPYCVMERKKGNVYNQKLLNFHVSYPRLYHLDLNPYCSVSDRNTFVPRVSSSEVFESSLVRGPSFGRRSRPTGPTINWSWSRPIRSGHESSELAELMSLLTHFNLSDEQDSWEFYHRSIKTIFSKGHSQPHLSSATPSYTLEKNASFKGKHPSLESNEQKVDTWRDVLLWWHIPGITITSLEDVLSLADRVPLESKFHHYFDVVVGTTVWHLWSFRNKTGMVDFVPGCAVIDAAHRKRVKYEAKCADIGYGFLPFSFSSLGELDKDAVTLL